MIDLEFLKNVRVFNGLNEDQLKKIRAECREENYKKGDRLFREGEVARYIWIMIDGQVDIRFDLPGRESSPESTLYSETARKTFGWSSFVSPYKYILSAYCASGNCKVARLDKDQLLKLFDTDRDMGYILMSNLAGIMSLRFHDLQKSPAQPSYAIPVITVHMATCGIVAGAREVMNTLQHEILKSGRTDIQVKSGHCLGKCSTEPNVTVEITGEDPVIYQKMTADKMRRVFREHVLEGSIITDFVLNQGGI
jgi:NADP-reducing hydrogenase subunit HndB